MLSVIDTGAPAPCPAPFNLAAYVLAAGGATPERIALQILRPGGAERWSYGRLTEAVLGVAGGLLERGLRPGDRLMLRLGNGVSFPLAFLGAIAAGIVPVPTPAGLTAAEVARVAAVIRPAMIVAGSGIAFPEPAPGHAWFRLVDTAAWYEDQGNAAAPGTATRLDGRSYELHGRTVLVLVEAPAGSTQPAAPAGAGAPAGGSGSQPAGGGSGSPPTTGITPTLGGN